MAGASERPVELKRNSNPLMAASDLADRFFRIGAGLFLALMIAAITLQVVARYVFNQPPAWTEEVARYAMVWVGLLGAAVSFKARFDPVLVRLPQALPRPVLKAAALIRATAVTLFLAPILWFSIFGKNMDVTRGFIARHLHLEAETFPLSTVFVAIGVPLFIIVILLHAMARVTSSYLPEEESAQ